MINYTRLKQEIKENDKNAPIVVIDSGIRGRENAAELFEISKDTEWEFFQDGDFLPKDLEGLRELPERALEKIEMIKALEPKAVFILSDRLNPRLQERMAREMEDLNVITSELPTVKKAPIIIIDSGVGGMRIAKNIHEQKPTENIIFIADTKFLPYGNKDKRIISRRAIRVMAHIKKYEPKAVILGCNTLDAIAGDKIEAQLGNIPLIRVIDNVAKEALNVSKSKQIGLLATTNTIESQKYIMDMLGYYPNTHLYGVECPELATAIEHRDNVKQVFKAETDVLKEFDIDTLILGCTHYSNILPIVKKEFPGVEIVDSGQIITDKFIDILENKLDFNKADKGSLKVITTQKDEFFEKNLDLFLGETEYTLVEENIL